METILQLPEKWDEMEALRERNELQKKEKKFTMKCENYDEMKRQISIKMWNIFQDNINLQIWIDGWWRLFILWRMRSLSDRKVC